MGISKRAYEEMVENEEMAEWIRERASFNVEEGDDEWNELKEEYQNNCEGFEDDYWDDEEYELEIGWLKKENSAFTTFLTQINEIDLSKRKNKSDQDIKMKYSYMITLMESCLSDMLKSIIFTDDIYLLNALKYVDDFKSTKITLLEVFENNDIVKKIVLKKLNEILYHNVEKVTKIYSLVLQEKLSMDIKEKIGDIVKIVNIRHDIVHRNGYDIMGELKNTTLSDLSNTKENIINFIQNMDKYIQFVIIKNSQNVEKF